MPSQRGRRGNQSARGRGGYRGDYQYAEAERQHYRQQHKELQPYQPRYQDQPDEVDQTHPPARSQLVQHDESTQARGGGRGRGKSNRGGHSNASSYFEERKQERDMFSGPVQHAPSNATSGMLAAG